MRPSTKEIHDQISNLGAKLGFHATREVDDSVLRLRLDDAYRPRIDLMWSLPLDEPKRKALAWITGRDTADITHLPIVGIEIEGTDPSTKTMASDAANLAALGAPLGLLVVSEEGERNIYRRAARAIRTVRRSFGDLRVLPVEATWLEPLLKRSWCSDVAAIPPQRTKAPAGGESLKWSAQVRRELRDAGTDAGFRVAEPFIPPILEATYSWAAQGRLTGLRQTVEPIAGTRRDITKAAEYLTESELDLAWLMPLPAALGEFLAALDGRDPGLREHGLNFSELWTHCAVVAFELESSAGKHAGGGLLNLSAYGLLGVAVTPDLATERGLAATLRTYQPTLGLRNVVVRTLP